jgi:hypothetical protein
MCILTGRQGLLEPQGSLWWGVVGGERHLLQLEQHIVANKVPICKC